MDSTLITETAKAALAAGRDCLTEIEGLSLLDDIACSGGRAPRPAFDTPGHLFVKDRAQAQAQLGAKASFFPGARAVVKVMSPSILHKTEVGGVAIVANDGASILDAIGDMEGRFKGTPVDGYTINEFVAFEPRLGYELILGWRFAEDFGPVISFGPGGIYAEFLAGAFKDGVANLFLAVDGATRESVTAALSHNALRTLLCAGLRNTKPVLDEAILVDLIMAFVTASPSLASSGVREFEVNPFVLAPARTGQGLRLVALDVLAKLAPLPAGLGIDSSGSVVNIHQAMRPVEKIGRLLMPKSAAVAGVSEKGSNNGRIILRNLIENGFDRSHLHVVKPGSVEIEGCPCSPDFASLPEKVDLAVLSVPARAAAEAIASIAESGKAETIIVTSGGLEEKSGTEGLVAHMRASLAASRQRLDRGPLINGGNCLGVRSVPGSYNTLFIPEYKLPMPKGRALPLALVSQSGAFAVSRVSKHPTINPKYLVTCGNQMDLTVGDYLEWLAEDPEIEIFAAYVEGFKALDGQKALRAARRIKASGRTLILYRAGRTAAGAKASASHTASIAGDWPVTRALFDQAGAVVVESLEDFDDALTTFALLGKRKALGRRLGAISNAGFECVAMADNLGRLEVAEFSPATRPRLEDMFVRAKIGEIVDVHNPLDLTPGSGDMGYIEGFRAILADPNVDCGVAGIVPLTPTMNSLAAGPDSHGEDVLRAGSLVESYGELMASSTKPWVASVDAGIPYDTLARGLEARGVPVFRTVDRALRMLNLWIAAREGA